MLITEDLGMEGLDLEEGEESEDVATPSEPAPTWHSGERKIRDCGKNLPAALLKGLSALNLPLERQQLWSDLVPVASLHHGHFATHNQIDGKTRVQVDLAAYGDTLEIIGLAYGLPGEGSGGWGASCMPRLALLDGVRLVLEARQREASRAFSLFPEEI